MTKLPFALCTLVGMVGLVGCSSSRVIGNDGGAEEGDGTRGRGGGGTQEDGGVLLDPDGGPIDGTGSTGGGVIVDPSGFGGGFVGGTGGGPGLLLPGGGFVGSGFVGGFGGTGTSESLGECEPTWTTTDRGYCDTELECDGGWAYVNCYDEGDSWSCWCDRPYAYMQFRLEDAAGPETCGQIADICAQGVDTVDSGDAEATCYDSYMDSSRDYCGSEVECVISQDLGNGITQEIYDYRSTYCDAWNGVWTCSCYGNGYDIRIEFPEGEGGRGSCGVVSDACEGDLELIGQPECAPSFQSAGRGYCDVQLECASPAQLGDLEVEAFEYRSAYCEESSPGTWSCGCYGGSGDGESFQISNDEAWEACSVAGERCAGN